MKSGAVIRSVKNIYEAGEPVVIKAGTSDGKPFSVTLRHQEIEIAKLNFVDVNGGLAKAKFTPATILSPAYSWQPYGRKAANRSPNG